MGMQEHAGEMEQKPEDDLDVQNDEEKDPASTEEASAESEQEEEKDDAKEEGPKSNIEQVVSDAVDKYGPQPPVDEMIQLANILDAQPGTPEYDEFMGAVQKFCGNGYGEQLENELNQDAEPEAKEEESAEDGGEPPPEAEAAEDQEEEQQAGEEKAEDPAAAEQEGPVAEEVPPELAEDPAVQEEVEAKAEESEEEAPAAEELKEENAEAVEAEGDEEKSEDEEEDAAAPQSDLRRGDHSPDVEELQNLLVSLGFMTQDEMDTGPGIFGPRTENALKAYQESLGVPATGFYGPQTRESLAQAAEPASPMEQIVLEVVSSAGPQPDFGVMVGVYLTVDAAMQAEFMLAVANQCGDEYATQLQQELENAASAPAANSDEEQKAEEPNAEPAAEEEQSEEAEVEAAPEEKVESEAPAEEIAEAKAEVVEVAPEVVPEEAQEQVEAEEQEGADSEQAAKPEEAKEEEASTSPAEEATEEAQEEKEEETEQVNAEPEAKEQAAEEQKEELAQAPQEAKVEDEEASEESEEELDAKKEQVENELDEEVAEQPDNSESIAALQALLEEADRLLAAQMGILQDPVLDTTQESIQADAEAMLAKWDGDLENYVAQLQELADKLTGTDLGQAEGTEEVAAAAAEKAGALQDLASSLAGAAPTNVTVNALLNDGTQLAFDAPISSRDAAVQEILQAFLQQLEMRESEEGQEEAQEGAGADAPNEA